jgi:hypothetical protein
MPPNKSLKCDRSLRGRRLSSIRVTLFQSEINSAQKPDLYTL